MHHRGVARPPLCTHLNIYSILSAGVCISCAISSSCFWFNTSETSATSVWWSWDFYHSWYMGGFVGVVVNNSRAAAISIDDFYLTAAGQVSTSKPWARSTLQFLVLDEANSNCFKWNDFFTFMLGICRMMLLGCVLWDFLQAELAASNSNNGLLKVTCCIWNRMTLCSQYWSAGLSSLISVRSWHACGWMGCC